MADPTYQPVFRHENWIDNVNAITSTGADGVNVRFATIAGDLHQLSTVVDQIDDAIDLLADPSSGGGVIGREPTILVPLDLQSTPFPGTGGWTYDNSGVAHPDGGTGGGRAVMGIALPNGIRLTGLRVTGGFDGAAARLIFQLGRARINLAVQSPDVLATIDSAQQTFGNPYDVGVPTDKALSIVDLSQFRYFLTAIATQIVAGSVTSLAAVQLTFAGASTD